jgi:hypothetical protein
VIDNIVWWNLIPAFLLFLALGGFILYSLRSSAEQLKRSRQTIDEAEQRILQQPEKVKPVWDLARATLEAYFNRNLSQITFIFWLSVLVLIVGFGMVIWGVSQSFKNPETLTPAAITSAVGVITEFIGATFLFIYRSAIKQATDYLRTLERINSAGMAMQILDTMPDETSSSDLKSETKAIIIQLLVRQAYNLEVKETAENLDLKK